MNLSINNTVYPLHYVKFSAISSITFHLEVTKIQTQISQNQLLHSSETAFIIGIFAYKMTSTVRFIDCSFWLCKGIFPSLKFIIIFFNLEMRHNTMGQLSNTGGGGVSNNVRTDAK